MPTTLKLSQAACAIALACTGLGAYAQSAPQSSTALPKNQFTGDRIFPLVRASIKKALCPEDQRIFESINFSFPEDANVERVRAGRNSKGKRVVEISSGYMHFSGMIVQSVVYDVVHGSQVARGKHWPDYISYLAWTINNQALPISPGVIAASVDPYFTWANIGVHDYGKFLDAHQSGLRSLMLDVFVFALLHEVGHHVLNHPGSNTILSEHSRQNEWEADLYAISGLSRLGQSTLGVLPYFVFSSDVEGQVDEPTGLHDPALCRGLYILAEGADGEFNSLRESAALACSKRIEDTNAAFAAKDRNVCYRPPKESRQP